MPFATDSITSYFRGLNWLRSSAFRVQITMHFRSGLPQVSFQLDRSQRFDGLKRSAPKGYRAEKRHDFEPKVTSTHGTRLHGEPKRKS